MNEKQKTKSWRVSKMVNGSWRKTMILDKRKTEAHLYLGKYGTYIFSISRLATPLKGPSLSPVTAALVHGKETAGHLAPAGRYIFTYFLPCTWGVLFGACRCLKACMGEVCPFYSFWSSLNSISGSIRPNRCDEKTENFFIFPFLLAFGQLSIKLFERERKREKERGVRRLL